MTNNPVADLIRNALDFVNRAAGEGIEIDGLSPEEFLYKYSLTTGDEDWDTLPDRISDALAKERDELSKEVTRLTAERDQAIKALSKAAEARGRAEGKLEASELPGIIDGWMARAKKAEAERDQLAAQLMFYKKVV